MCGEFVEARVGRGSRRFEERSVGCVGGRLGKNAWRGQVV